MFCVGKELVRLLINFTFLPKQKGTSRGTSSAKPYVALFDYDPYKSNTSGHPELELKLRKGDQLSIFGEMDLNGYFEAELNGVRGLVPSLFVEEVDDNVARLSNEGIESKDPRDSHMNRNRDPYGSFTDVSPRVGAVALFINIGNDGLQE